VTIFDVFIGDPLTRWLQLAALGVVVGAMVAPLLDREIPGHAARRLVRVAGTIGLLALVGRLFAASKGLTEPGAPVGLSEVAAMLQTAWGRGWMAQVGSMLAVVLLSLGRRPVGLVDRLAVLAACAATTLTGHATTFPAGAALGTAVTTLHVSGAACWLGTLGALLSLRTGPLHESLRRFAPVALTGATLLFASGLVVTWGALGGLPLPGRLGGTDYGRVLAVKLGVVALILAAGAWHWRVAAPGLARGGPMRSFVRTAWLEVVLAAVVLAVTAVLGLLDPPGHA
jgi:copper transport protein